MERRQIQTRQNADAAFQLLSDPAAWRLFDPSIERVTQRPVSRGTTWSYRGREYTCVDLTPPVRFAIKTGDIVIEHDIVPVAGGATISVRTTDQRLLDEHFELLVHLDKIARGQLGTANDERIQVSHRLHQVDGAPAITVVTVAPIRTTAAALFDLIAGKPDEFWKWMNDRNTPGGLFVDADWPRAGSTYRYKRLGRVPLPFTLVYTPPGAKWDSGTVTVKDIDEPHSIRLHEIQKEANAVVLTTFELDEISGVVPAMTTLTSEYTSVIRNWFFRRFFTQPTLDSQIDIARKQTANIIAVAES